MISDIKTIITHHLTELQTHFENYFPELSQVTAHEWICNPFLIESDQQNLSSTKELIELNVMKDSIFYLSQHLL